MENSNTNMASEPAVAFSSNSYTDVMGYLHRIRITPEVKKSVAQRLLVEISEPYLSKAFARIDDLSQLKEDWDGRGAKKISYYVLENLRNVLLISNNNDWKYWMISPDTNGALGMQAKGGYASISIGDKEFSYYYEKGNDCKGESHIDFSPERLLTIMRQIA